MNDFIYVIQIKTGEYLCDRFYHRSFSKSLAHALRYHTLEDAEKAANTYKGTAVLVGLTEIEMLHQEETLEQ